MYDHPDPDLMLAALLFLLTQFVVQGERPALSLAVVDHLERLNAHLDRLPPRLSGAIPRLLQQWHAISGAPITARVPSERQCRAADGTVAHTAKILRFPARGAQHG